MTWYLIKEIMGSKIVVVGQYKTEDGAIKRKKLECENTYSFEKFFICTESEYSELLLSYV